MAERTTYQLESIVGHLHCDAINLLDVKRGRGAGAGGRSGGEGVLAYSVT